MQLRRMAFLATALGAALVPGVGLHAAEPRAEPVEARLDQLEGRGLRLSELRGRPVLLDLWATWCLPCREQAAVVHGAEAELAARGITVLAVNQGESKRVVRAFLEAHPSNLPVALDPGQRIATLLDVGELPALALLDRDGRLVALRLGLTSADALSSLLEGVAGEPPLPRPDGSSAAEGTV